MIPFSLTSAFLLRVLISTKKKKKNVIGITNSEREKLGENYTHIHFKKKKQTINKDGPDSSSTTYNLVVKSTASTIIPALKSCLCHLLYGLGQASYINACLHEKNVYLWHGSHMLA